jgi:hypothetical protein
MNIGLDLSKIKARQYRAQWRFIIDCPPNLRDRSFYTYYMGTTDIRRPSRWSLFISQIMATKLSRAEVKTLPEIREILPISTKLVDIHPLFVQYNALLARLLVDVGVVFDASPYDLKVHITVCFGIPPSHLQHYLDSREDTKKKVA